MTNTIISDKRDTKKETIGFLHNEKISLARGKRTNYEIRSAIQKALSEREMTTHEITVAVEASRKTIERHLSWLKELGEIKQRTMGYKDREKRLWGLAR